jgi:hypothetical protein
MKSHLQCFVKCVSRKAVAEFGLKISLVSSATQENIQKKDELSNYWVSAGQEKKAISWAFGT